MKITTTALIITLPLAFITLSKGETVRDSLRQGEVIKNEQSSFSSQVRISKEQVKKAKRLSGIALERVKVCTPTFVPGLKANNYYKVGEPVLDNRQRSLSEGRIICNELGETAVIGTDGTITDIASISVDDFDQFKKYFSQRKNGSSKNGGKQSK